MALLWEAVPLVMDKGAVFHLFVAHGPSGSRRSLNGHLDRLPPGWFTARGRQAIREEAELDAAGPAAEPGK